MSVVEGNMQSRFGTMILAATLLSFSTGCTVGGLAVGSAIDRSSWERAEVSQLSELTKGRVVVRGETAGGERFEGKCEHFSGDTLLLNPVPKDDGLFSAEAIIDTVDVSNILLLESLRASGRYRDLFMFSGLVLDAAAAAYIVGGLSRGFE